MSLPLLLRRKGFTVRGTFGALLAAWYNASQETPITDGTAILPQDFSGNARHMVQATGTKQPLYKTAIQNGQPIFRGDGVDDITTATFAVTKPATLFAVLKQRAISAADNQAAIDGVNTFCLLTLFQQNNAKWFASSNGANLVTYATADTTAFHRIAVVYNGASSVAYFDATGPTAINLVSDAAAGGIALFSAGNAASPAQVDIAEVILVTGVVSAANIAATMAYLKAKWGLV